MRHGHGLCIVAGLLALGAAPAGAGDALPSPAKTCSDVRAYVDGDTITMDRFKALMTAAGNDLSGGEALDNQCKLTAYVKHVVITQHILSKDGGGEIRINTEIVNDNGVCKLTQITLDGC